MIYKVGEIIRHKTMVDKSIRVELDLGEIPGSVLSELYEMEKARTVGVFITSPEEYEIIVQMLANSDQ